MRVLMLGVFVLLTACSQQPVPLDQLVWPPDSELPTGGTIPIKRMVDFCKEGFPEPDLCRELHRSLTSADEGQQ